MKVVWVNKREWQTPGPIVNIAVFNAAAFARIGHESHLCIGKGAPSDTRTDLRNFYALEPLQGFHVHRIERKKIGGSTYSFPIFRTAARFIKGLAQEENVAVFTRESGFLPYLAFLCRSPRIRGYYELHDLYADLSWVEKKRTGHYREWLLEHLFLPRINGLICITHAQKELYRKIFPKIPASAFPLGTLPRKGEMDDEDRRSLRTLMYVGHIHRDKGIDFLLEAAARLKPFGIHTLLWGGKPGGLPRLREKANALGIGDAVSFADFQPPEAMHNALAAKASIGIVMLRDTFYNRYLTCPVKALDYLSHGIPTIGSDLPAVREVLGEAGIYVKADDSDGFAAAVTSLLDDPIRYKETARAARARAEEISWENRAKGILNFISDEHAG